MLAVSLMRPTGWVAHTYLQSGKLASATQQFVSAGKLQKGERLRTLHGLAQVRQIIPRGPPEPVYNLEVSVDHTYLVGQSGAWVHNESCKKYYHGTSPKYADDIAENGLDCEKLMNSDKNGFGPVEGEATEGFYVAERTVDAEGYGDAILFRIWGQRGTSLTSNPCSRRAARVPLSGLSSSAEAGADAVFLRHLIQKSKWDSIHLR